MKLLLVAGARPNFMKLASIVDAIRHAPEAETRRIAFTIVHTGQHYDDLMSGSFFRELGIPEPDINLEVGSSSHAEQTAKIMQRFEPVVLGEQPDVVVVVGDVNSTLACSLVASKISYPGASGKRPKIAHVEAGLRSFDRSMPEEINRLLTDALSDFLFITEESARENLLREGLPEGKIHFVGNTMVDTLLKHKERALSSKILERLGIKTGSEPIRPYALVTLHRPSNVDSAETLTGILEALEQIGRHLVVLFPVHPRTLARIRQLDRKPRALQSADDERAREPAAGITYLEPLPYLDFLCLMSGARVVVTDSGGIQEETTVLEVPCVTVRENTERPVTLVEGSNVLAGTSTEAIVDKCLWSLDRDLRGRLPKLWDGAAGRRIVKVLQTGQR